MPENWKTYKLGEIAVVQTGPFGSQLHASDYVSVGIPSIMPVNIGHHRINSNGIARITEQDAQRLSRYRVEKGDIIYSRRGDIERHALVREKEKGWLCGTGCLRIRFGESFIEPLFASYYLELPNIRNWIVDRAVGSTMPNLNTSILSALPFIIPPIEEQRRIAEILSALDEKIELNLEMNRTLERIAQATFKHWFVDFQFPGFDGELVDGLPKGWRKEEINNLAKSIQYGFTQSSSNDPTGYKFLRITDIQGGTVNWSQVPYCKTSENELDLLQK